MAEAAERPVDIRVFRSIGEADAIGEFWRSCPAHRDAGIDFYALMLGSLPEAMRPHILAAYRAGRPVALLLARFERRRIHARIAYLGVRTPTLRLLNFLYGGRLGEPSAEVDRAFIATILASLRAREADAAMLHYAPTDSPLYDGARAVPGFWRRDHFPSVLVHRARRLPTGPGALLASLSANERSQQRRRTKRLRTDFGERVRIDGFRQEGELDRLLRDAEAVARASYQRALGVGFHDGEGMRRRLALEAGRGSLRAFILYLDDRPCSFWILSLWDGVLYNDFLAYDQAYARYAPGIFLVIEALAQICDAAPPGRPYQLDFGMGEMEWKARLGDQAWREGNIYIFGATARALCASALCALVALADRALRTVLARIKLESVVKRAWRRRLAKS